MDWLLLSASLIAYAISLIVWLSSLPAFCRMFADANQPKHREVMILFPTLAALLSSSYGGAGKAYFKQFKVRFGYASLALLASVMLRLSYDYLA